MAPSLLILLLMLVIGGFLVWAILRITALGRENNALAEKLGELERDLRAIQTSLSPASSARIAPFAPVAPPIVARPPEPAAPIPTSAPPVLNSIPEPPPIAAAVPAEPVPPPEVPPPYVPPARPRIGWEQFMGARLFAWLGGLAAFLGAAFFVKYSFDHNLIPPELRVAIGFLFALGLIVGGLMIPRDRYAITAQTLCATGIVSLYGVTFACNSIYHFAFFGPIPTFLLMSLITAVAFLLAVRLEAQVVAVLGILGGFLTPVLLSTGRDNPAGLFGYLALLNTGLLAIALHRRWHFLVPLGAAGTIVMQIGWASKFLNAAKAPTAMMVCLGFCALFLVAHAVATRLDRLSPHLRWSAVAFPFVAFAFAVVFLDYPAVASRPGLLFPYVLAADACLLALAWRDERLPRLHLLAGIAVFGFLAAWTGSRLTDALLPWALVVYLVHAALHTVFPLALERRHPAAAPTWWSQLFPPLALLLMLGPLFKLEHLSYAFWPCVLLVDLLAIGLALFTASLVGVGIVLILTLAVTAFALFRVPVAATGAPELLFVIGGFAGLFFAAGLWLARRLGDRVAAGNEKITVIFGDARAQVPAFSALLPFLLLIMMTQRLQFANPSPVFGLALLLTVLTLGLTALLRIAWLPACALIGVAALELSWLARQPRGLLPEPAGPLAWAIGFLAIFAAFPFVFRRAFAPLTGPWAVAALAGVLQFPFLFALIKRGWPNDLMGLLPAALALAPLASLGAILRAPPAGERTRLNQLAWFGGAALFFITLIFPVQFDRQWLTLGWALEGVALLWLFHRVPHPGLRATGVVLLVAAFVRLALNPAILVYHARSATPILNWYLYSYGLVTLCLFAGGRLLAPPRERTLGVHAPSLLGTLGTVLAFFLLNIEIADYFTPAGARRLVFEFSGSFARDMTYTIAWALFALILLLASFWKKVRAGRWAALALLGVVLLKLFFHDLARLEALYRIGALFAVAVVAIAASYAYQRWLPVNEKKPADPT